MTTRERLAAIATASPLPTCPLGRCADMEEIRAAAGMPGATVEQLCERVRQLRQVEVSAGRMMEGMTCR